MADNHEVPAELAANLAPLTGAVGPAQADPSEHIAYATVQGSPAEAAQAEVAAAAGPRAQAGRVLGKLAAARAAMGSVYARAGVTYANGIERAVGKLPQSKAGFAGVAVAGVGAVVGTKLGLSELGHHAATIASSSHEHLTTNAHLLSAESASPTPSPTGSAHESASATASAHASATASPTGTPKATPSPTTSGSGSSSPSPSPTHGVGNHATNPNQHVPNPTNTTAATQEHVTVLGAKQTGRLHRVWAAAKSGVAPNANFMTKFIPGKHGTTTIKLTGMHPGGTTFDGKTFDVRGADNLEAVSTVDVNGHQETIEAAMHGTKLSDVPTKLLDHASTVEIAAPGKDPEHLRILSTVEVGGKPLSGHHQLDRLVADYQQNSGQAAVPGTPSNPAIHDVLSTTTGDTHTTLIGSHSVEITHNNETLRIGLPKNVLTPDGSHHVNLTMPTTGVTFENDHWQVTHAAEAQINREMASHGLMAVFKTDGSHNVLDLKIVAHGIDTTDLTAPTGYNTSYLANQNELQFTLPHGGEVDVRLPIGADIAGQLDLNSAAMHRAIVTAFHQHHFAATFYNDVLEVTKQKGTNKGTATPTPTATPTTTRTPRATASASASQQAPRMPAHLRSANTD